LQYLVLIVGGSVGDCTEQVVVLGRQSVVEHRQEEQLLIGDVDVRVAGVGVAEVTDVVESALSRPGRSLLPTDLRWR